MNKIDLEISRILADNARISFTKVAEKLGISTNTVIKRYNELRKKMLPYSSLTVNLNKLGYVGRATFLIKVTHQQKTSEVVEEILQVPNIIVSIKCLGTFDAVAVAPFATFKKLLELNEKISRIPGVQNAELLLDESFSTWPLNVFAKLLPNQPQDT